MQRLFPGLAILLLTSVWMWAVLRDGGYGVTWDEPWYVQAAALQTGLWDVRHTQLADAWEYNCEHPPLAKYIMGIAEYAAVLLAKGRDDAILLGARGAVILLFGCMLLGVWVLTQPLGRLTAGTAVILCAACPRLLGHAQLATLDMPLTCFWVWTLVALERATRLGPGNTSKAGKETVGQPRSQFLWWVALFALFSTAFMTKFTGIMLLAVVGIWGVLQGLQPRLCGQTCLCAPSGARSRRWLAGFGFGVLLPLVLLLGAVFTLVLCWPWLWEKPLVRFVDYVAGALDHKMAPVLYLGRVYGAKWGTDAPPWHYALLMLSVTTPLPVVLGALLAAVPGQRRADEPRSEATASDSALPPSRLLCLVLLSIAALPAATMLPSTTTNNRHTRVIDQQ